MKYGVRTPSFTRSVKARTTGRIKRAVKKEINPLYGTKAMGVIRNPEKAVYNRVYDKTTIGTGVTGVAFDAVTGGSGKGKFPKTSGKNADGNKPVKVENSAVENDMQKTEATTENDMRENKPLTDKPASKDNGADAEWVDYINEPPNRKPKKRLVEEYSQHPEYADKDRKTYLIAAIISLIIGLISSVIDDYICLAGLTYAIYCFWHRRTIRKAKEAASEVQDSTQ